MKQVKIVWVGMLALVVAVFGTLFAVSTRRKKDSAQSTKLPSAKEPIDVIIFDLDGTLVDTHPVHFTTGALFELFMTAFLSETLCRRLGFVRSVHVTEQEQAIIDSHMKKWSAVWNKAIDTVPGNHWLLWHIFEKWSRTHFNFMLHWQALQSVSISEKTLGTLIALKRRGIRLFLLSNTPLTARMSMLQEYLDARGLGDLFEAMYDTPTITRIARDHGWKSPRSLKKPNPFIFEVVLKLHKLEPHQVLFVDNLRVNTLGARNSGIRTGDACFGYDNVHQVDAVRRILLLTTSADRR
jgi:FMN phosphatase YigB (HAD superfamily)